MVLVKVSGFRCIIPVVSYLQLNSGSFESKQNYLTLLSLFELMSCFVLRTGPSSGHKIYITDETIQCGSSLFYLWFTLYSLLNCVCDLKMTQCKGRNMSPG